MTAFAEDIEFSLPLPRHSQLAAQYRRFSSSIIADGFH